MYKSVDVLCQNAGPEAEFTSISTASSQSAPDVSTGVQSVTLHGNTSASQPLTRGSSSDTEALNELMANLNENMTRQGVSTESKGLCAACSKPIIGQVLMRSKHCNAACSVFCLYLAK